MYYITEILSTDITANNVRLQNEEWLDYCSKQKGNCHSVKFVVTMKIIPMLLCRVRICVTKHIFISYSRK